MELIADSLLNQKTINQIGQQVGLGQEQTAGILGQVIPALLGGLNKNSNQSSGLESLFGALVKDHNGSNLNRVDDIIDNPEKAEGPSILDHIFGGRQTNIENQIGRTSGIDLAQIAKIFSIAAPIVMAALGKQRKQADWNMSGLSDALTQTTENIRQENQQGMSWIEKMIDSDNDGSTMDDIAGIGMSMVKNWMRG